LKNKSIGRGGGRERRGEGWETLLRKNIQFFRFKGVYKIPLVFKY
jgi:hypothetical protein